IFIYTNEDYSQILQNLKAAYKPNEKLIYEYDHWHYCLPDGHKKLLEMINELNLAKE
ncbi:MAG: hypothetical protein IAF38_08835, partial [Bacteroidia bacterium]|nr:hypothetical protein [Bacteroidia bacterium]